MADYDLNPADLDHVPVELHEVQELLADDGKPLRDKKRARHFLQRLVTTLQLNARTLQRMHHDLGVIQREAAASQGVHGNADPRLAAKYMSPEDLYPALDGYLKGQVDLINQLRDDARDKLRQLQALQHQIDFVMSGLLERGDVPDSIKQVLSDARHQLPDPSQRPTVADDHVGYPDMTPPGDRPAPPDHRPRDAGVPAAPHGPAPSDASPAAQAAPFAPAPTSVDDPAGGPAAAPAPQPGPADPAPQHAPQPPAQDEPAPDRPGGLEGLFG